MKQLTLIFIVLIIFSCENTTQLKDYWKNPDFETYNPKKILVIGMTTDNEARHLFESHFQTQLQLKGIKVDKSQNILTTDFLNKKHTETEINKIEDSLIKLNYDTVIFSRIVGVKNKIKYSEEYYKTHTYKHNFKDDFLKYQDQFYNPSYYENYNVYNAETSIYCLCPSKERTLIWKGYIDILDPKNINDSIEDYIKLLILVLEEEAIIPTPK